MAGDRIDMVEGMRSATRPTCSVGRQAHTGPCVVARRDGAQRQANHQDHAAAACKEIPPARMSAANPRVLELPDTSMKYASLSSRFFPGRLLGPRRRRAKSFTIPFDTIKTQHMVVEVKINARALSADLRHRRPIAGQQQARKEAGVFPRIQEAAFALFGAVGQFKIKTLEAGDLRPRTVGDGGRSPTVAHLRRRRPHRRHHRFTFFARYKMTIDYQKKVMTFTPNDYTPRHDGGDDEAHARTKASATSARACPGRCSASASTRKRAMRMPASPSRKCWRTARRPGRFEGRRSAADAGRPLDDTVGDCTTPRAGFAPARRPPQCCATQGDEAQIKANAGCNRIGLR